MQGHSSPFFIQGILLSCLCIPSIWEPHGNFSHQAPEPKIISLSETADSEREVVLLSLGKKKIPSVSSVSFLRVFSTVSLRTSVHLVTPEHLLGSETPWNRAQGGLRAGSQSSQPRQSRLREFRCRKWSGHDDP